jgi:uncharacterized RDD family membrane protein YckC
MTETGDASPSQRFIYNPERQPELFDGILSKRIVAFVIDAVFIVALMVPAALLVAVLGFVTLGLAWFLYPALFALVALGYYGFTLGGANSATPGMQVVGIELRTWNGQRMFPLLAVMHALIFWFSCGLLTPLILLVGLFTARRQLLHDLLLGVVALNSAPLART